MEGAAMKVMKSATHEEDDNFENQMRNMEQELMAIDTSPNEVPFVARELADKAQLFAERHAVYGDNYHRFGPIMAQLMATQKLDCTDSHQMSRFGIFVQIVSKVTRYAENFERGGHDDSLDDIAVYAMMLKEIDRERS